MTYKHARQRCPSFRGISPLLSGTRGYFFAATQPAIYYLYGQRHGCEPKVWSTIPALPFSDYVTYDMGNDTIHNQRLRHNPRRYPRGLTLSLGIMFAAKTDMTGSTCERTRDGGQKTTYFSMKREQNPGRCLPCVRSKAK